MEEDEQTWTVPDWLSEDRLARLRIWECLYVPSPAGGRGTLARSIETTIRQFDRFAIQRSCTYFHLGMDTTPRQVAFGPEDVREILQCLDRWPQRLIGCAVLNAAQPAKCLENLDRWIRDGPMVGVLFPSSPRTLPCTHPNFEPIVRRARELDALIVQHTWFKTGGKGSVGESTPAELAELARRHPDITFVCVHAGGEWEKGIRAVEDCPNVLIETSGFDPTAGFIELAVRALGADRVMFGRERSFGTELAKVLGGDISEEQRRQIFGANLRRQLTPIFRRKGWSMG